MSEACQQKTVVDAHVVAQAVGVAITQIARRLPCDVYAALEHAREVEEHPRGRTVLDHLLANAHVAARDCVPICQDTGTVWVCLEVGPDVLVPGDVFSGVDDVVARAYTEARLRMSVVRDAILDRANTGNNTPAFTEVRFIDEPGAARLSVMLKGGGSDNASRVVMLVPGDGREAIVDNVVRCVREKAANACAPLVVGVGIGATFDKVAGLAKHALLRPVGVANADARAAELERELLEAVNATGLGPGGLGGATVALDVHVETAPCHIAALPLAINMGCSALRRATIDLASGVSVEEQLDEQLLCADKAVELADTDELGSTLARVDSHEAYASSDQLEPIRLDLPFEKEALAQLHAGDSCLLTGPLYALRDAGHLRLMAELDRNDGVLPYGLAGQAIFYAGPTPEIADRPFGAVGPTTASRMDFATPALLDAGVCATIGKGRRSQAVKDACVRTGSVYFTATGGAAALLAKQVKSAELVAYGDLGTEALRRIEVVDFPVFVGVDAQGNDVYDEIAQCGQRG